MKSKKRLDKEGRTRNARKWLQQQWPKNLLQAYSRRYSVSETLACDELMMLGYWDEIQIQSYEQESIEWEYMVDGYSGDMKVVPKGTPEWELYNF